MRNNHGRVCGWVWAALVSLSLLSLVHAEVCRNVIDDSFFNRCRKEEPAGILNSLGQTITTVLNPTTTTVTTLFVLYVLPLVTLLNLNAPTRAIAPAIASYQQAYLNILNFLHRMVYTLTLNVGLYVVFRQRRPCDCGPIPAEETPVGSRYGMPSGDAMSGGIVGMYFIMWNPYGYSLLSKLVGLSLMVLKDIERVSLGFHSLGQVLTGTTLGIFLSIYSERAPQYMIIFDTLFQFLLGAIAFPLDKILHYKKDDPLNILSWFLWGAAVNVIICMLVLRFYQKRRWAGFRLPLRSVLDSITADSVVSDESRSLLEAGKPVSIEINTASEGKGGLDGFVMSEAVHSVLDLNYMFLSLFVGAFLMWISYLFQVYGWGY